MSRFLTLLVFSFSGIWWVSCQTTSTAPSSSKAKTMLIPMPGVHSIEDRTPDMDIAITIEGLSPGVAKLIGVSGDQNYILDTTIVDGSGSFRFKRAERIPEGFYYVLLSDFSNFQMLVDANQRFSLNSRVGDLVNSMQVSGSRENELLYENLKFQTPIDNQIKNVAAAQRNRGAGTPEYDMLQKTLDSLAQVKRAHLEYFHKEHPKAFFTKFKLAGQNPEITSPKNPDGTLNSALQTFTFREDLWNNVDFSDPRLLRTPVVLNKLTKYIKELTPQNADSIIFSADRLIARADTNREYFRFFANFIPVTYSPGESNVMDAEAIQVHMTKKYFTTEKAYWASSEDLAALAKRAYEMEASLVGRKGPDVAAKDISGQMRSIYGMKSPYVVVFMWNPECSHCREETPQLVQFLQEWKSKGVDVFGIAVNTTDAEYRRKVKEYGMTWSNVFDPTNRAIYAKYYVDNTPEVYVLDPERTIIAKNLKVNQLATVIERDMAKRQK